MEFENRIEYSNEYMMLALEGALEKGKAFRYNDKYRNALGESFIQKAVRWDEDIRRRKNDPFTVVVIGDFKRGKSTFINALLGEEVVTTDVTTETVTLNRISYGAHSNTAILSGNRQTQLSDSELRREELEKVFKQVDERITRLELKRPCEMLKKITIIDTPGTGDALHDFSDMVKESLIQADAVIYVFNVRYPLSQSEQIFLKSAVLSQQYTSLFLVGNYADTLEEEESLERVRAMLKKRVEGLLPNADIAMVSALDEVCRQMGTKRPCKELEGTLEAEFSSLRTKLEKMIAEKTDSVALDRMQRLTMAMANELEFELNSIEKGLSMSREEAASMLRGMKAMQETSVERQTELIGKVKTDVETMKQEAVRWMHEFLDRLDTDAGDLSGISDEDLFKYYEFYCVDLLQEALQTCVSHHQEKLYDLLDDISEDLGKRLADNFGISRNYNFRISLDNRIWTKGDTVGFALSMFSSNSLLANMASLVADGITGAMRQKEKKQRVPEIISRITSQITSLTVSVTNTVTKLYDELNENAQKLITEHYTAELENANRLMEQSIQAANREEAEKEQMHAVLNEARDILHGMKAACMNSTDDNE